MPSFVVEGKQTPHWSSRLAEFLQVMQSRQAEERKMAEIERQRSIQANTPLLQSLKNPQDQIEFMRQRPEIYGDMGNVQISPDPVAEAKEKFELAKLAGLQGALTGGGQQQTPQGQPFDFAVDGRVGAPQQAPPQQQLSFGSPQTEQAVGQAIQQEIQKSIILFGHEGAKLLVEPIMMKGMNPVEQLQALKVANKVAPDANALETTRRTGMEQEGQNYRHRTVSGDQDLSSRTQVQVANINQAGANTRHTTQSADSAAEDARGVTGKDGSVTDATKKAAGYAGMMEKALGVIDGKDKSGASLEDRIASGLRLGPGRLNATMGPDFTQSKDVQAYRNAARVFTEARVRNVSGATIKDSEYEKDWEKFFVQYGDRPETIKQKREMRRQVLDGLRGQTVGGGQTSDPAGLF
jgi:hypothetical protein